MSWGGDDLWETLKLKGKGPRPRMKWQACREIPDKHRERLSKDLKVTEMGVQWERDKRAGEIPYCRDLLPLMRKNHCGVGLGAGRSVWESPCLLLVSYFVFVPHSMVLRTYPSSMLRDDSWKDSGTICNEPRLAVWRRIPYPLYDLSDPWTAVWLRNLQLWARNTGN